MNRKTTTIIWAALGAMAYMGGVAAQQAPEAHAQAPALSPVLAQLKAICQTDIQKLCPNVQPGGGRVLRCMSEHQDEISPPCKQAIAHAQQSQSQGPAQSPAQSGAQR